MGTKEPGATGEPLYLDISQGFSNRTEHRLLLVVVMDLVKGHQAFADNQCLKILQMIILKIISIGIVDDA